VATRIENYALLGDTRTLALVSKHGSIDWLCAPRPDSGACFAALLGQPRHGCWSIAPADDSACSTRCYRDGTLVLETEFSCASGRVRIVDCMLPEQSLPHVVRVVEGIEGVVPMRMELIIRFDYGRVVPWVRKHDGALLAIAGPDALTLRTPLATRGEQLTTVAEFEVSAGQRVPFVLCWHPSNEPAPAAVAADESVANAERWWRSWIAQCTYSGPWRDAMVRSLVTLKALTYSPTGGILAAATTSLPERPGGVRNWDYRYCWLRDATFTLYALKLSGYHAEASAWRNWLRRAIAGSPSQLQVMYGVAGERRIPELTLDWLPGYEHSQPVRLGNAAIGQFQLDVYGEVIDALHQGRRAALDGDAMSWPVEAKILGFLEDAWREPDASLWEVRGPNQHFTHSKLMAWVAFDRGVKAIERFGLKGPLERWRRLRDEIRNEVLTRGYDARRGTFTQAFGSSKVDAALLMMPLVGFLPAGDPRMVGTVAAIERELMHDGLVARYRTEDGADGLPAGEGVFLLCSFWLADNYALMGRLDEARELFERLLALRNDVGLLAEEYDPHARRMLGNFPQAFSHVGMINTIFNLNPHQPSPADDRG
jgi:GH15 family glucan-1,4-alpha-glucosidase